MFFYTCDIVDIDKIKNNFDNFYLLTKNINDSNNLMSSIKYVEMIYKKLTNVDIVGMVYASYKENNKYLNLLIGSNKPIDVLKYNFLYRVTDIILDLEKYNYTKYKENNNTTTSIKKEYDSFESNKDAIINDIINIDTKQYKTINLYYNKDNKLVVRMVYYK